MPESINLRTDRVPGELIESQDVNQIAQAVNHLAARGGGGVTVHGDLTGRSEANQHPIGAITGLTATLANKTDVGHQHSISNVTGLQTALNGKAATGHTHDDRYYTETEVKDQLEGKADVSHQHPVADLETTGTPSAATYLRGDGAWATPEGGGGGGPQIINEQAGSAYVLVEDDAGAVITASNAFSVTLVVPRNTFTTGQRVDVLQRGAGSVTLTAGSGMTLNGTPSLVTRAQWSAASVLFLSATEAVVIGDLAEPSGGGTGGRG